MAAVASAVTTPAPAPAPSAAALAAAGGSAVATHDFDAIPVIDIGPLFLPKNSGAANEAARAGVAAQLYAACRRVGFFYVKNHGVSSALVSRLFGEGKRFFSLPAASKAAIHMRHSDCFRGWFALGEELTSKKKDWKEGLYFGAEEGPDHPDVRARVPMHGANLWPDSAQFPGFDALVLEYMSACTALGHTIMHGIALALGLPHDFFRTHFTAEPFTPFRLFYYPTDVSPSEQEALATANTAAGAATAAEAKQKTTDAAAAAAPATAPATASTDAKAAPSAAAADSKAVDAAAASGSNGDGYSNTGDGKWGVGEHTDYGVLTILAQDDTGGLEVKNCRGEWVSAPPIADTFVINIGDMLQIWTSGLFPATPHRVVKSTKANRLSAPFFFDPNYKCTVVPLQLPGVTADAAKAKPIYYGDYILKKVEANFAQMKKQQQNQSAATAAATTAAPTTAAATPSAK